MKGHVEDDMKIYHKRFLNTLNLMSMAVMKVRIKPEFVSMSFIKYTNCIIFESIEKPSVTEFEIRVGF